MKTGAMSVLAAAVSVWATSQAWALPTFPGAEGYGAVATGGRNGDVYHVTSLADTNTPGTLRYGIGNTPAAGRTIVFDISGTIALTTGLNLSKNNLTIAGQTAPGMGITLKNESLQTSADNLVVRYMRSRFGDQGTSDSDGLWGRYHSNIMVDHFDASWSVDECLSLYANTANVTVQYSMATESLWDSHHEKGNHGYGGIWGGNNATFHHNLIAHNTSRNPRFAGDGEDNIDFRNNVIYNWGFNSAYGGEDGTTINMVNNYFKHGPATDTSKRYRIVEPSQDAAGTWTSRWYIEGNYVYGNATITANNWNGGVQGSAPLSTIRSTTPFATNNVYTQTALDAYTYTLDNVGANLWQDSIDARIINEVKTGTATYGGSWGAGEGIIDSQDDVGGWPAYPVETRPAGFDTDGDGMPNTWETAHGLNPNLATDRTGDYDTDGYNNLEEYLNELGEWAAPTPQVWNGTSGRFALTSNWSLWQPSRFDTAKINSGAATVDAIGQNVGTLLVGKDAGSNGQLNVTSGWLLAHKRVEVGSTTTGHGSVTLSGGTLRVGEILRVRETGTINFTGGQLDITSGVGIFDYSSSSPLTALTAHLASDDITSSSIAPGMAVGIGEADVLGVTEVNGESVDDTTVLLRITWLGDSNMDGQVTISDLGDLASNWQSTAASWTDGDFNYDGQVTISDLGDLASNWQAGVGSPLGMSFQQALAAVGLGELAVPEPTAVGVVFPCLAAAAWRRRR